MRKREIIHKHQHSLTQTCLDSKKSQLPTQTSHQTIVNCLKVWTWKNPKRVG